MSSIGQLTQYYLISIVTPGFFNASVFIFASEGLSGGHFQPSYSTQDWIFLLVFSSILTLLVGMRTERWLYRLVHGRLLSNGRAMTYSEFACWRVRLLKALEPDRGLFSQQLAHYVEQTTAKYYCINNILSGLAAVVIYALVACLTTFDRSALLVAGLFFGLLLVSFFLARGPMRTWLEQIDSLMADPKQRQTA